MSSTEPSPELSSSLNQADLSWYGSGPREYSRAMSKIA